MPQVFGCVHGLWYPPPTQILTHRGLCSTLKRSGVDPHRPPQRRFGTEEPVPASLTRSCPRPFDFVRVAHFAQGDTLAHPWVVQLGIRRDGGSRFKRGGGFATIGA